MSGDKPVDAEFAKNARKALRNTGGKNSNFSPKSVGLKMFGSG